MSIARYSYMLSLKLRVGDHLKLMQDSYPGAADINLASRDFSDYNECVTSCKQLVSDVVAKANAADTSGITYVVSSEVNPLHTGQATLSTDWATGELARLWVFDGKQASGDKPLPGKTIVAISQARIFKTDAPVETSMFIN